MSAVESIIIKKKGLAVFKSSKTIINDKTQERVGGLGEEDKKEICFNQQIAYDHGIIKFPLSVTRIGKASKSPLRKRLRND